MKKKLLLNFVLAFAVIALISSCVNLDEGEPDQTKVEEQIRLNAYIDSLHAQNYDVDTTDLGVYYVVLEEGDGEYYPQLGDTLTIGYSGYLMGGYMFDSSEIHFPDGKWEFVFGETPMIDGWNDGLMQMNKGDKYQLMIPSELAYGSTGSGIIGPNQTLIFVVRMFDIKPVSTE